MMHRGGAPGEYGPQSRAKGITRAILDTFPLVHYRRPADAPPKDVEEDGESRMWQMRDMPSPSSHSGAGELGAAAAAQAPSEAGSDPHDTSRRRSGSMTQDLADQCDTAFTSGQSESGRPGLILRRNLLV